MKDAFDIPTANKIIDNLHAYIFPLKWVLQTILRIHKLCMRFLGTNRTTDISYTLQLSVAAYIFSLRSTAHMLGQTTLSLSYRYKYICN